MSRVLKTSGFLGLAVMMFVGLYMAMQLETGGGVGWLIAGHAHLGVLSILAIVVGSQVDALDIVGRLRRAATGLYLVGQWLLPTAIWVVSATGIAIVGMSTLLWVAVSRRQYADHGPSSVDCRQSERADRRCGCALGRLTRVTRAHPLAA